MTNIEKWNPNGSPNREKGNRKRGPKMDTKKGRDYATAWGVGGWGGTPLLTS